MNIPTWSLYFVITYLVSIPFYLSIRKAGGTANEKFESSFRQMLLIPGLVAFGFRIVTGQGFNGVGLGVGEFPWLFLPALFIPLAMEIILIFAVIKFGLAKLDRSLIQFRQGQVHISPSVRLLLGNEKQSYTTFALNLLVTVSVGALFMLIFSFAEEFGWRGYLQVPLIQTFGLGSGLMLGGILWGLWHAPLIFSGYKFPAYPRMGAFVYWPIFTLCLAIITGWFYWQSGSIWIAAMFNASWRVSGMIGSAALGEAGDSRRVRVVWLWLWGSLAVFFLALMQAGGFNAQF